MHTTSYGLFLQASNAQEIKVDFLKQKTLINLMRQSDSLPCDFQDVKLLTNDKRQ